MQIIKTIGSREVEFLARIRGDMKLIDVRVIGGGQGPCSTWIEAWAMAHALVKNRDEYEAAMARCAAEKEAARMARVAKHEAKQKRRALAGVGRV